MKTIERLGTTLGIRKIAGVPTARRGKTRLVG
jgi:hypothetical protein